MGWGDLPSWLKGMIIADSILILYLIVAYFSTTYSELRGYIIMGLVGGLIYWGGLGALIGFVVGKIKSKKEANK
jgi:hypothetical protein